MTMINRESGVALDMLKVLAMQSDKTVKRSTAGQNDLTKYQKSQGKTLVL